MRQVNALMAYNLNIIFLVLMQLLILVSLIIAFLFIVLKKAISFFKLNLFRDQRVWSAKDIKIDHKDFNGNNSTSSNKIKNNYLKVIAEESKTFLDEHS